MIEYSKDDLFNDDGPIGITESEFNKLLVMGWTRTISDCGFLYHANKPIDIL